LAAGHRNNSAVADRDAPARRQALGAQD